MVHKVYHGIDILKIGHRGVAELVGPNTIEQVFSPSELAHIGFARVEYSVTRGATYEGIDIQAAAANLAMKEALVKAWIQAFNQVVTISDFEIGYGMYGQPYAKVCPMPRSVMTQVSLSASHDGDVVIGSAVLAVTGEELGAPPIPASAYDLSKPYKKE